jgi:homospermidine synthase
MRKCLRWLVLIDAVLCQRRSGHNMSCRKHGRIAVTRQQEAERSHRSAASVADSGQAPVGISFLVKKGTVAISNAYRIESPTASQRRSYRLGLCWTALAVEKARAEFVLLALMCMSKMSLLSMPGRHMW